MKNLSTPLLLATTVLAFGCMPETTPPETITEIPVEETPTDTAPVHGNTVLLKDEKGLPDFDGDNDDTGELRLDKFEPGLAQGKLTLDVRYASDEDQTALITIMGETKASTDNRMAEFKIDEGYSSAGEGYAGVRLRNDATYEGTTLANIPLDTWVTLELAWNTTDTTYNVTIGGTDHGAFTLNTIKAGGYEPVGYIAIKISDDDDVTTSATPLYIDNITVHSDTTGTTVVFEDDFEDFTVGADLKDETGYSSSSYNAIVSDDRKDD
jgi:hypothetical protein